MNPDRVTRISAADMGHGPGAIGKDPARFWFLLE